MALVPSDPLSPDLDSRDESTHRRQLPFHPAVVALAFVTNSWIAFAVSPFAVGRALIVAVVVALSLFVLAALTMRSADRGALVATICIAMVIAKVPPLNAFVLGWLLVAAAWVPEVIGRRLPWRRLTRVANILATALLIAVAARGIWVGWPGQVVADLDAGGQTPAEAPIDPTLPDIYLVLLDAYARDDWLATAFDFDNEPFLQNLKDRGFEVYPNSNSNYDATALTMASMFNLDYLGDLPELSPIRDGTAPLQPTLRNATSGGRAFDILRRNGYVTIAISAGWEEISLRRAEIFRDLGTFNEFEQILLETTGIGRAIESFNPDFFGEQVRSRVDANLAALADETAVDRSSPRFVFVHIPSPHYPAVLNADGSPRKVGLSDFYSYAGPGADVETEVGAYVHQVAGLNRLVLRSLDDFAPATRPRVVILFSDHGSLTGVDGDAERLSDFLAVIAPGKPNLFGGHPSPVNILRIVFAEYLGEPFEALPVKSFRTTDPRRLTFREVELAPRR